ncbi:Yip1 family protein [Pseudazoarcus pumilus]|uniref:YIP1 family protein n=1 Tax=Pseudazoarcus pumilus TaxID=2067960 RepID=A0A2I6S468_9RHOO|nr:Yip1 family protein [Pseudazoarcus pumilus]AUN94061.1 YIP1 family protein [Pseudazoarcus pumilus]
MDTHNLPKMFWSYSEGWQDVIRQRPGVTRMMAMYVMPMSLIPAAMFMYALLVTPGAVLPAVVPHITTGEALVVATMFFAVELGMVALMASMIQQMGDVVEVTPDYDDAFMLAAIAPTPLWLAPLALFVPSVAFNVVVAVLAWIASAALIYHGVYPLFRLGDRSRARVMGTFVLLAGIIAWAALMVVLSLLLSMVVGLR